jgi:glycosyltransferase involved in cell wall biosynthesis
MDTISIILCTYNGEKYLDEQISSIVNQTYSNFELIISDDASTDGTVDKLRLWSTKDKRIKLFFRDRNIGFNANFEYALRQASGSLIAISDQDDIWDLSKIEKMLRSWKPGFPVIHCDSQRFTGNISLQDIKKQTQRRFEGKESKKLFFFNSVNGHAMMIRKDFLHHILPFEDGIYYDWWTAFVASCNGGVDYLDETLVFQRVHDRNASIDKQENKKLSFINYREQVKKHIMKFITAPII